MSLHFGANSAGGLQCIIIRRNCHEFFTHTVSKQPLRSNHVNTPLDRMSGHQPVQLLLCEFTYLIFVAGPHEFAIFQPFVYQKEAVSLPEQPLDPIRFPTTEKKQNIFLKRIQIELSPVYPCAM